MSHRALSSAIGHHHLCIAIVWLSMALLAAPAQSATYMLPRSVAGMLPAQLLFNVGAANEEGSFYGQPVQRAPKPAPLPPNYFANKWPGLRDLLLTADYDDANALESNELNSRLLARLRKLSDDDNAPNELEGGTLMAMPAKKYASVKLVSSMKEHNAKKNAQFRKQYMSPCHFKICNMGRKRSANAFV